MQYKYGWIFIAVILILFLSNLFFVFLEILNQFRLVVIMIYNNWNNLRLKFLDLIVQKGILDIEDL